MPKTLKTGGKIKTVNSNLPCFPIRQVQLIMLYHELHLGPQGQNSHWGVVNPAGPL